VQNRDFWLPLMKPGALQIPGVIIGMPQAAPKFARECPPASDLNQEVRPHQMNDFETNEISSVES
jgi:hypothetical protein